MKAKKNPNEAWELLEKQWSSKLSNVEEELPEALFEKVQERLGGQKKRGGFFTWSSARWVAAASILILIGMMWRQQDSALDSTPSEIVRKEFKQKETDQNPLVAEQPLQEKPALVKVSLPKESRKKYVKAVLEVVKPMPIAPVLANQEMPKEPLREVQIDVAKLPEKKEDGKAELVAAKKEMAAEELFVIVDVEPVRKEKGFKKVLGFIQKVKTGKVLEVFNASREGKLNEGIHQVVNKYQEKEEKIKTMLSL